jgi:hypothetical protein
VRLLFTDDSVLSWPEDRRVGDMTDLIERVNAVFVPEATPALEDRREGTGRSGGGTNRALPILLAVTTGSSAVLWFAIASGHLHGARATAGIVAALAQVAFTVAVLARPSRGSFAVIAVANVPIGAFWLGVEGPHGVSVATVGIGIALSILAVSVGGLLALRPSLGDTWSSGTSVIGSLLPLGVVVVTLIGLFATTTARSGTCRASVARSMV